MTGPANADEPCHEEQEMHGIDGRAGGDGKAGRAAFGSFRPGKAGTLIPGRSGKAGSAGIAGSDGSAGSPGMAGFGNFRPGNGGKAQRETMMTSETGFECCLRRQIAALGTPCRAAACGFRALHLPRVDAECAGHLTTTALVRCTPGTRSGMTAGGPLGPIAVG